MSFGSTFYLKEYVAAKEIQSTVTDRLLDSLNNVVDDRVVNYDAAMVSFIKPMVTHVINKMQGGIKYNVRCEKSISDAEFMEKLYVDIVLRSEFRVGKPTHVLLVIYKSFGVFEMEYCKLWNSPLS